MKWHSGPSALGDTIWSLIALHQIGGQHDYWCPRRFHWQLHELVEGTQITLHDLTEEAHEEHRKNQTACLWIASDTFMQCHECRWDGRDDIISLLAQWSTAMAHRSGVDKTFTKRDMLAPFPAIVRGVCAPPFEVLVVNCPPGSGQAPKWDQGEMDSLIGRLAQKHKVICTNPTTSGAQVISASVAGIGNLSLRAKMVLAVASGGSWCCWNRFGQDAQRYVFDSPQFLDYDNFPIQHAASVPEMAGYLERDGWL